LEVTVLRFVRIALLVAVPFVAAAAFAGCNDDTTNTTVDMSTPVSSPDLKTPADLAQHD
jgi:hypothetical protein